MFAEKRTLSLEEKKENAVKIAKALWICFSSSLAMAIVTERVSPPAGAIILGVSMIDQLLLFSPEFRKSVEETLSQIFSDSKRE